LVIAAGIRGEVSDEFGAAEDGDVIALADDVAVMSCPSQPDTDTVGRDVEDT
jgi:hypothetical protein